MANEKRLISIDEALEATHREPFWTKSEAAYIRSFLVKLPKADAVEVVHGRWLTLEEYAEKISADPTGYAGGWRFCSECEQPMRELYGWAYCPNCGAKMDGDGNA